MLEQRIEQHFIDSADLKYQAAQALSKPIAAAVQALMVCVTSGGKVLACGNGGSAAAAQHFAAGFVGGFERERPELAAIALATDSATLTAIANDEVRYLPILGNFISTAAAAIDADTLVVLLNARDLARMNGRWESFSKDLATGKILQLSRQPLACSGGALLHDTENRVRVNQTFEGRKQRMNDMLAQVVMEKLFPVAHAGVASHG